jgi:thiamine pyrophosphate-dependent acetolactate synthase large subunit-like protein
MAYGYAAATGNLVVCCGTVGPGATNLVSGIAVVHLDSVPMLVITGQVGTKAFPSKIQLEEINEEILPPEIYRSVCNVEFKFYFRISMKD